MPQKERVVQPTSQATGFATDFIAKLLGEMSASALGTGVGPQQRAAGTAAQQVVNSGGIAPATRTAITDSANLTLQQGLADLGEQFGAAGTRVGSSLARSGSRAASDTATQVAGTIAPMAQQGMLQGIELLNRISMDALMPFLQIASQGIFPTQHTFEKNPLLSVVDEAGDFIGNVKPGGF